MVLTRVGGIRLLERTLNVLREAGLKRIVLVGDRAGEVAAVVRERKLPVEVVADGEGDVGTSLLAGLRSVRGARFLVVEGDHMFEADDVRRLLEAPGRNVLAVDHGSDRQSTTPDQAESADDLRRAAGSSTRRYPTRVRIADGRVLELGTELDAFDAFDVGLMRVHRDDLLSACQYPTASWDDVRRRMLENGSKLTTCQVAGLWSTVDSPAAVRPLEQLMWRRYGPKPADGILARVILRRISGPMTRRLLPTGIAPDTATAVAFPVTLVAAGLIASGNRWMMLAGGLGVILGCALDGVDGELARVSGRVSRRGAALDTLLDRYGDLAVVLGLVLGSGGTVTAWAWGFGAVAGSLLVPYIHAVGSGTGVILFFRREFRLFIFAFAAIGGVPLWGLAVVAIAANLDAVRGVVLLLRALRS